MKLSAEHKWTAESVYLDNTSEGVTGSLEVFELDGTFSDFVRDVTALFEILTACSETFGGVWRVEMLDVSGTITANGPSENLQGILADASRMSEADSRLSESRGKWKPERKDQLRRTGIKKLQSRWSHEEECKALEATFVAMKPSSPYGTLADGSLDLRGIDLGLLQTKWPELFPSDPPGGKEYTNTFEKLNLAFARTPHTDDFWRLSWGFRFRECTFDGIKIPCTLDGMFEKCSLRGLEFMIDGDRFVNCDFSFHRNNEHWFSMGNLLLDFTNAQNATMTGMEFENCSFRHSDFGGAELGMAKFVNCDFTGAAFDNTFYAETVFRGCIGLDPIKMYRHTRVFAGEYLSQQSDIIIE